MISRKGKKLLLDREPRFDNILSSLKCGVDLPKTIVKETADAIAYARKFNDEVIRPNALKEDIKTFEDPDYLPWDIIKKANEWGFYTMFIPRMFGGKGLSPIASSCVTEELASACVGFANVMLVHYLGVVGINVSWNMELMNRIFREVVRGEESGKPCIISLAITEPEAGTDVEENELVDRARLNCRAQRVDGGYIVNGSKVFISMGHVSDWCCLTAYTDLKKPSENAINFAVKKGMKGFYLGRHENKMGQRVCPASELVFEDCFIPDDLVLTSPDTLWDKVLKSRRDAIEQAIHYVLSVTRPGVGAFGTGVARGAYEKALEFASTTKVGGRLLINHEWAQTMLAEMYKNVLAGRLAYMEANYANSLPGGIYNPIMKKSAYYYQKYAPQSLFDKLASSPFNIRLSSWLMRAMYVDGQPLEIQQRNTGLASFAKVLGTDAGVKNCHMALEMMGQAGLRHDRGAEKILRDSKLLQIYEGTNQLNRLNMFANLIGNSIPWVRTFQD